MERKYLSNPDEDGNLLPPEEFADKVAEVIDDKELMTLVYMSDDGTELVVLTLEDK